LSGDPPYNRQNWIGMSERNPKVDIVTVDGPGGSGKSTISRLLAGKLGYLYLDTGAMYRAVALQAKRTGAGQGDPEALGRLCAGLDLHFEAVARVSRIFIGEEDVSLEIRRPEMDLLSSTISAVKEVREAMTALQRRIGLRGKVVAEGRDMGTVVFPDAMHKFFLMASPAVRAERRYLERRGRGESIRKADVERELRQRDEQDSRRVIAPLKPAPDAVMIDTSALKPDEVIGIMLGHITGR
jgi:CMP/dCMP kinase